MGVQVGVIELMRRKKKALSRDKARTMDAGFRLGGFYILLSRREGQQASQLCDGEQTSNTADEIMHDIF